MTPALLALVGIAILVSLGNWQLRRLAWKEGLIAAATERPAEAVRDLPPVSAWPGLDPLGGDAYRPYSLAGRFLHDKEARVFTSLPDPRGSYGGPGFWVVTPFALSSGGNGARQSRLRSRRTRASLPNAARRFRANR